MDTEDGREKYERVESREWRTITGRNSSAHSSAGIATGDSERCRSEDGCVTGLSQEHGEECALYGR